MTTAAQIRSVLAEGPATTHEIAAETGIGVRLIGSHLGAQAKRRYVRPLNADYRKIYALTPIGLRAYRRDLEPSPLPRHKVAQCACGGPRSLKARQCRRCYWGKPCAS